MTFSYNKSPLAAYFNGIADILDNEFKISGVHTHKGVVGANREIFTTKFLNNHLPRRLFAMCGGQVLGIEQPISQQIDIVIVHDCGIRFEHNGVPLTIAESVAAAVSVKSNLDKTQLLDALSNILSIPFYSQRVIEFPFFDDSQVFYEFLSYYPKRYIFAFDGLHLDTMMRHLNSYFDDLKIDYPVVVLIVVNLRYYIACYKFGGKTILRPGTAITNETQSIRGWPLLWTVADLSKIVPWLAHMQLNYQPYLFEHFPGADFTQ